MIEVLAALAAAALAWLWARSRTATLGARLEAAGAEVARSRAEQERGRAELERARADARRDADASLAREAAAAAELRRGTAEALAAERAAQAEERAGWAEALAEERATRVAEQEAERTRHAGDLAAERQRHAQALAVERERQAAQEAFEQKRAAEELALERGRAEAALTAAETLRAQLAEAESSRARLATQLEAELKSAGEKLAALTDQQLRMEEKFGALSRQALDANSAHVVERFEQVLARAQEGSKAELDKRAQAVDELVRPVRESLDKVDSRIQQLEKSNEGASAKLAEQVRSLTESGERVRFEAARLSTALRAPAQRGRWGENQLRRTIELAGLREHVDFTEQPVVQTADGMLRPDVAVHLPGGKTVLIDSKVPFEAYQRAVEGPEGEREALLKTHAAQLRTHVEQLSRKQYWEAFQNCPEMIVMFLPGEGLLAAALQADPGLEEDAFRSRVVLATPATLLPLLLTVAHVWKQEAVALNAREIANHGRELHKRIATLSEHLAKLGRSLGSSLAAYNSVVSSFETRLLPGARKFEELRAAAADVEIEALPELEGQPKLPSPVQASLLPDAN